VNSVTKVISHQSRAGAKVSAALPTFFTNGVRYDGNQDLDGFTAAHTGELV